MHPSTVHLKPWLVPHHFGLRVVEVVAAGLGVMGGAGVAVVAPPVLVTRPGPIRGEHRGHVIRSPPITAQLIPILIIWTNQR